MTLITRLNTMLAANKVFRFSFQRIKSSLISKCDYHAGPPKSPLVANRTILVFQKRTFFKLLRKPTERQLKKSDDIPDQYTLIYRNGMGKYIYGAQVIVTVTAGLAALAFALKDDRAAFDATYNQWSSKARAVKNEDLVYITVFAAMAVMLQTLVARMPMRIYKIPRSPNYILMFNGIVPFSRKRLHLPRGKIFHLEESGVLPWRNDRYLVKLESEEKRVILLEHYFRRPADLYVMLGVQKDPELDQVDK